MDSKKRLFIIIGCLILAVAVCLFFLIKKDGTIPTFLQCGDKIAYQGDTYRTVRIGEQCWMKENLETTKYRDNTPIANLTGNAKWSVDTSGAYVCYQNIEENCSAFGALYNWYAVNNPAGLCPEGWSVPSNNQWTDLEKTEETDIFGGFRNPSGPFSYLEERGFWWTSALSGEFAYSRMMDVENQKVRQLESIKSSGFSVRCIKD